MYLVEYAKALGKGFEIVYSEYFYSFEAAKESAEHWEHTYYTIWKLDETNESDVDNDIFNGITTSDGVYVQ